MPIPRLKSALEEILYEHGEIDYFREIALQLVNKAVNGDTEAIKLIIKIEED